MRSRNDSSPTFFISSNTVLVIWSLLLLCVNFRIGLSISTKQIAKILIVIALNLHIKLGRTDILTILSLPVHEHRIFLHLFSSLNFSSSKFCSFFKEICTYFVRFIPKYFIFGGANVNGIHLKNFKFYLFITSI